MAVMAHTFRRQSHTNVKIVARSMLIVVACGQTSAMYVRLSHIVGMNTDAATDACLYHFEIGRDLVSATRALERLWNAKLHQADIVQSCRCVPLTLRFWRCYTLDEFVTGRAHLTAIDFADEYAQLHDEDVRALIKDIEQAGRCMGYFDSSTRIIMENIDDQFDAAYPEYKDTTYGKRAKTLLRRVSLETDKGTASTTHDIFQTSSTEVVTKNVTRM